MKLKNKRDHLLSPYGDEKIHSKPLVTVALAAYNEEALLEKHLDILCNYLNELEKSYDWEIILVNDGSCDKTGEIAERYSLTQSKVIVIHHSKNGGLGKALQTAFDNSSGDYVITLDIDLSCSEEYIGHLLDKITEENAALVVASPYAKGGKMSKVPFFRKMLSVFANKFLTTIAPTNLTSLTCMVRVYNGEFIRSLYLRSNGMEIMPEIIYKATVMNGKIAEIPAHLDWSLQVAPEVQRQSSMKIFKHTCATLLTGFLLRPFLFIILPGILLFLFSLYPLTWMFIHFFGELAFVDPNASFLTQASEALRNVYQLHPHTCLIGILSLVLALQLLASGFQSLQSKHYFEELLSLGTEIRKCRKK